MKCQHCGADLPNRAEFCHKCGMPLTSASTKTKSQRRVERITRIDKSIGNDIKRIGAAFVVFLAVIVGSGFGYNIGNIDVPDVGGMELSKAESTLLASDVDKADIEFKTEDGKTITDKNETIYVAINQQPVPNEIIRDGDKVIVKCEDYVAKVENAFDDCLDEDVNKTDETAEEYDFEPVFYDPKSADITQKLEANSKSENEKYVVDKVKEVDFDKKEVSFLVDTEENLEARAKKQLTACQDEKLADAITIAESIRYDYKISTPTSNDFGSTFKSLSGSFQDDYLVTKVGQIDYQNHVVSLEADSKEHIEKVKIHKKYMRSLKKKIPYRGMKEAYIDNTLVGVHDDIEYEDEDDDYDYYDDDDDDDYHDRTLYIWKSDDEQYRTLVVACENGKVVAVSKKDPSIFWTSKGKPNFSADKDKILADRRAAKKAQSGTRSSGSSSHRSSRSSGGSSGGGQMVWIPNTGQRYHYNPNCSNMSDPKQVTLDEAENMGYTPCHNCVI